MPHNAVGGGGAAVVDVMNAVLWWGLFVNVFKCVVVEKKFTRFCENKKNGEEKIVS